MNGGTTSTQCSLTGLLCRRRDGFTAFTSFQLPKPCFFRQTRTRGSKFLYFAGLDGRPENQNHIDGKASGTSEFSLSEQYDSLIEKYRYSCSGVKTKQSHAESIKNGAVRDLFMGNTLISAYARNEDLVSAVNVLDEMPAKNSVTWSCLISGLTLNGMLRDAIAAFREMVSAGFFPNQYALGSALRACQTMGGEGFKHGMQIHGFVSKTHYSYDVVVSNVLISMYGNCFLESFGRYYALRVFEGIISKNSISWNSIISVYSRRGDAYSAFCLFSDMQKEGLGYRPTEYTFVSLITAATESVNCDRPLLLKQLLAKIEMSGFMQDLYVCSALVNGLARFGAIDIAKKIFKNMSVRNAVSLNGLIVGLVKLKRGEEAVEMFLETRNLVTPNSDSFVLLLSSFGEFLCPEIGKKKGKEGNVLPYA